MSTTEIYHYLKVNEYLITGGQPSEEQIRAAAEEGFTTVINLATLSPRYSLPDEAGLVQSLGMTYHHIPVEWDHPKDSDFETFDAVMQSVANTKTLVHCAANFRVTAFYSLYALKHLGWTPDQAAEFRATMWFDSDYPIWEEFIARLQERILGVEVR
jgi:uncharacterized protein (TIGR01244 family)